MSPFVPGGGRTVLPAGRVSRTGDGATPGILRWVPAAPDPGLPDLSGSVALVTGGAGGIGAGVAERFAAAGAAVVVHHRDSAERAAAVVDAITRRGHTAVSARADITDPAQCATLVDESVARFGRLDAVVACAGVQPVVPLDELDAVGWRAVFDVNATGTFATLQAAVPRMPGGGSITLVASIEGTRPAPGHAHYAASKAAVIMLARAAALEHGPRGIRVNSVSPGLVDRPGLAGAWPEGVDRWRAAAPLGRLGEPGDVGDACVFLASPMARWITGHDLVVDGGVSARPGW
jgi:NAD(P)-dependent dehydrogenase (short-subunit alcohol dehydrogenase family)